MRLAQHGEYSAAESLRDRTDSVNFLPLCRRSKSSPGRLMIICRPRKSERALSPSKDWVAHPTVLLSSAAPHPLQRNLDPALHPFSKTREYTRAVTAAKMDRMFAKPFVGAIEGHQDGVYCLARDPRRVGVVAGGGGDGGQFSPLRHAHKS